MGTHVIHFYGPITPGSVQELRNVTLATIHQQQQAASEILLLLSSEGGNITAGFTAYHFLQSLPVPLTIHNTGNVESMGVIMLLAGTTRLSVACGKFAIHAMHWGFGNAPVDHNRLLEYGDSLNFDLERYSRIFKERTSGAQKPIDVKEHLTGRQTFLELLMLCRQDLLQRLGPPTFLMGQFIGGLKWLVFDRRH